MCQVRNSIPHLGFGQSKDYVYAGSRLVAELDWGDSVEPVRYVATDHLGSTRYRIKPDGTAVGEIEYYPFGAFRTGGPSPETTHLFTGHERDLGETSSQLDYMHARYYSFNLGRFLSVDPVQGEVGSGQSWNRYAHVENNPIRTIDPDGEETLSFTVGFKVGLPQPLLKIAKWVESKLDPVRYTHDGVVKTEGFIDPSVLGIEFGAQAGLALDFHGSFGLIVQGSASDIQGLGVPSEISTQLSATTLDSINDLQGESTSFEVDAVFGGASSTFTNGAWTGATVSPEIHLGVGIGGGQQQTAVLNVSDVISEALDRVANAVADYLLGD